MNILLRWFNVFSSVVERYLWSAVLIALALTVAGQAVLTTERGRRLLNPVESLEGVPWPPEDAN